MSRLITDKLHTGFLAGVFPQDPMIPRRYTLTHSNYTGELFLSIGPEYNTAQLSGICARLMRDEILGEWQEANPVALHLYCHVNGGWVLGPAAARYKLFKRELPLIVEALRYGDRRLFSAHPNLDQAPIIIHFSSTDQRYDKIEHFGQPGDFNIRTVRKTTKRT